MAPDPSPNMLEQSHKATGFFSLPRELRDRSLKWSEKTVARRSSLSDSKFVLPYQKKRLVSRQFKSEYDQRSAVNTSVRVFDIDDRCTFEDFPRLALNACYLELHWDSASDDEDEMPMLFPDGTRVELPLKARLKPLEELASHFPGVKDVHIQPSHSSTHNLKGVVNNLIACPVLTSFTVRSHEFSEEGVDLAIWSCEHGFLVDNTDEGKEKRQGAQAGSRKVDTLYVFGGTGEGSIDDFMGHWTT
ncbi:hypothetical protein MBLNU13_g07631t2 [Cladosporium sp. NU13]